MSFASAVRRYNAAVKRAERTAARNRKQLQAQQKTLQALSDLARANHAVESQQNYLDVIVSLHHDTTTPWDWSQVAHSVQPAPTHEREAAAHRALSEFKPGLIDRMTGAGEKKRQELQAQLARARHDDAHASAAQVEEWRALQHMAYGVLRGDLAAYRAVVDGLKPFDELEELGVAVRTDTQAPWYMEAVATVRDATVVPKEELSVKKNTLARKEMAAQKYWGFYEDYLCSAAIRTARDLFGILPVQTVLVHVASEQVSPATGHIEPHLFLSVQFDRAQLLGLNFEQIDPSDAVARFNAHNGFKKKRQPPVKVEPVQVMQQLRVG